MTTQDVVRALVRRWYIVLLGLAVSLGALFDVVHVAPTYFTQYSVVLLPPRSQLYPNTIEDPHYYMSQLAGLVVTEYNGGVRTPLLGSGNTTLYGEGIHEGSRVRVPNEGSQWEPIFSKPNIDVQVVGADPVKVEAQATKISAGVQDTLNQLQNAAHVQPSMRVTALVSSQDPIVVQVRGSRMRAVLGVIVLGASLTLIVTVQGDVLLRSGLTSRHKSASARASDSSDDT